MSRSPTCMILIDKHYMCKHVSQHTLENKHTDINALPPRVKVAIRKMNGIPVQKNNVDVLARDLMVYIDC